ncbi:MAG: DUF2769 domain-containing protein [Alphaproteobacteria bacterium]|nr:DUF2769 domain-containing protein [Alphaproteobacteria bacterium]
MHQVPKTYENMCSCICMMCPSYEKVCKLKNINQSQDISTQNLQNMTHYEKMFCAFEKSNCIHFDKGCICQRCEVFKKYGLKRKEFCLKTGGL